MSVDYLGAGWPRLVQWTRITQDALSHAIAAMRSIVAGKGSRLGLVVLCAVTVMVAIGIAHAADSFSTTLTMPPNNLGIVGWWTFDGPTINGTTVKDVSGQGNNGTMVNGPTPVPGVDGQALSFNGTSQYINVTNSATLQPSQVTACQWIKSSASPGHNMNFLTKGYGAGSSWTLGLISSASYAISFGIYNGSWHSISSNSSGYNDGKWHSVCGVSDGNTMWLYVDGVQQTQTATGIGGISYDTSNLQIGAYLSTNMFSGDLDDVRVYNRPLSAYEIKQMYNAGTATHQNATVNPPNLQNGLVGHWTLDGPTISGTTVKDVSGQGNNGTMVGSPAPVAGVMGQALSFNGTSQYVTLPGSIDSSLTNAITVSFWVKANGSSFQQDNCLVTGQFLSGIVQYFVCGNWDQGGLPSNIGTGFYNGSFHGFNQVGSFLFGKWTYITSSYDGTTMKLYINGVLNNSGSFGIALPASTNGWYIGRRWDFVELLNGSIDDVRIYNRALSAAEVQQLYDLGTASHQNATINPPDLQNGLVGHWTFDGPTISGTTVKDVSGSGNNGTMVNGPTPVAGVLGQALSFNGTSQYVTTANSPVISAGYTMATWFKTTTSYTGTNWVALIGTSAQFSGAGSFEIAVGNAGGGIGADNGAFLFFLNGASTYVNYSATALNDGKWHLLVGGRTAAGYPFISIDGETPIVGSTAVTGSVTENPWYIGAKNDSGSTASYFNGSLDDVRIYNRALSATEVQQLYNLGR